MFAIIFRLVHDYFQLKHRDLDLRLKVNKSVCVRFGSRYDTKCADIISSALQWVDICGYLGVYFTSGRLFKCCFHNTKCRRFRSFNSMFTKVLLLVWLNVRCNLIFCHGDIRSIIELQNVCGTTHMVAPPQA